MSSVCEIGLGKSWATRLVGCSIQDQRVVGDGMAVTILGGSNPGAQSAEASLQAAMWATTHWRAYADGGSDRQATWRTSVGQGPGDCCMHGRLQVEMMPGPSRCVIWVLVFCRLQPSPCGVASKCSQMNRPRRMPWQHTQDRGDIVAC